LVDAFVGPSRSVIAAIQNLDIIVITGLEHIFCSAPVTLVASRSSVRSCVGFFSFWCSGAFGAF
jgi:hypothetical protein